MRNHSIKQSRARAPGKLILSGEHAVVYQQPAIAIAVNKHVTTNIKPDEDLSIHFLEYVFTLPLSALAQKVQAIKNRYEKYQQGKLDIKQIFEHPSELVLLILDDYKLNQGLSISLHSELPIGCGMGTSAALILSCLTALNDYFDIHASPNEVYQQALVLENFQHGKSSGLDISISQLGGALFIEQAKHYPLNLNLQDFCMIHTGKPSSTTGECVEHVKKYKQDQRLWKSFSDITHQLKLALEKNNVQLLNEAIKENHKLLMHIGVVPQRVAEFIQQLELLGYSAKISGAGSIRGESGGMVIVAAKDITPLQAVCERFHYTASSITGEPLGARVY